MKTQSIADVTLPIRIVSEANVRECWQAKHRRSRKQRDMAYLCCRGYRRMAGNERPVSITLTRIGRRKLDGDNLQRGFKAVRDGVADALGVDDGSDRITWQYRQEKGEYAVRIEIRA